MLNILSKSIKDFFSPRILTLTLLPAFFGILLWGSVFYALGDDIFAYLSSLFVGFLPDWLDMGGIIGSIIRFCVSFALYALFGFVFVVLMVLTNVFFSLFYTPFIVEYVRQKDFPHLPKAQFGSFLECLLIFVKTFLLLGFLALLSLLLYLIPFFGSLLGSFALFVVWYIFFKKMTFFDVGSSSMQREQWQILIHTQVLKNHAYALLAYLFSFVPFLNFFLMPLQILLITHYFFTRLDEIQSVKNSH